MSPRILFVRPDHVGDVLLTLPAVAGLRRAIPRARIAYAVAPGVTAVPERCPDVDDTVSIAFPPISRLNAGGETWNGKLAEAARLAGTFDAALVVKPDDPWSAQLVAAAGVRIRIGFDMPRTRPFLTDALPVPRTQHVALDGFELADALLRRLGRPTRTVRALEPSFVPTAADEDEANSVVTGERPIVLHPGSGWPLKNWAPERWRAVATALAHRYATRPLVAGTPAEQPLTSAVADGTPAVDIAGRLSLGGLAAVHRRARLVVTTDSGALHVAAAAGAPVVALFGPGDPVRFAPFAPAERVRIVRAGLPCSPCGTLENPPCGASVEPACVTAISVASVLGACAQLLQPNVKQPT